MRRALALAALLTATTASAAGGPPPSCPAGTNWSKSQTIPNDQTTYTITAPCFVTFPAFFVVTVTVRDTVYTSRDAATDWSVVDTRIDAGGATSVIGSGMWITPDPSGLWTRTLQNSYTSGTPVNHRIEFRYKDLGNGPYPLAHGWQASIIGTVTYDPYPDESNPGGGTPPDGAPSAEPAGGCGSSGAIPALLGVLALVAAAWPRSRARS